MKKYFLLIAVILFSLNIASCAKEEKTPTVESTYTKAKKLLSEKSYSEAAKEFEKLKMIFLFQNGQQRRKPWLYTPFIKTKIIMMSCA